MDGFLLTAFLFLIAGIIAVPLATRFGLGSVLGYLIAGIVISPLLRWLGVDLVSLQHFAEFGVVMMLFLVGLELEPRLLWQMKARLLGLGGLQVALTTGLVMVCAIALGQVWTVALAIGLVFSLSSTAIVLQTLNEKGLMRGDGGQASFSVLLFQDIAVIPMLALLPLLALPELGPVVAQGAADVHGAADGTAGAVGHGMSLNLVEDMQGWMRALVTVAAVAVVVGGGSYLTRPLFRYVASAGLRELFTATALMMVIGIAVLMSLVGLSPALGTFLAGVVLANSEYRHELESDVGPFKGLLLGLFFITVGAGIDFALLSAHFAAIVGLALGLITIKATVLLVLSLLFKVRGADRWLLALGLAQAGEFGFVLLSFTVSNRIIPEGLADQLLLVVTLSMLLTPALFILFDRVIAPRFVTDVGGAADDITETGSVIIAGHGRFGGVVNRILKDAGYSTVVLDHSYAQLELIQAFGIKVFYGDAARPDLLFAAGIAEASLLVVAIDNRDQTTQIVRHVCQNYPQVHVIARARDRGHVYELYSAGCRDIIRETFDSAVRTGRSALEALGMHPHDAELSARAFTRQDKIAIRELAELYDADTPVHQNAAYVARARALMEENEAALRGTIPSGYIRAERRWAPPPSGDGANRDGDPPQ
ncbi:cation:proton antiporter [Pseudoruegeria sp. SK021]|uniref:cation:proton antiporter domain-containing protein n=1 Tax=Pseudoruegeria sp. SK021 TaxID=1933035 RepID=UPI000A22FAD9|nr:cation:proton antiporter [Pseudoruegeria sp. SK021]OSP55708.1 potassium transporter [Pseudoruegeria sp. SK021]